MLFPSARRAWIRGSMNGKGRGREFSRPRSRNQFAGSELEEHVAGDAQLARAVIKPPERRVVGLVVTDLGPDLNPLGRVVIDAQGRFVEVVLAGAEAAGVAAAVAVLVPLQPAVHVQR